MFDRRALWLVALLCCSCGALMAQAPPPDWTQVAQPGECTPCHSATAPAPTAWDAAGLYPEYEGELSRRLPVDMTAREWVVWQELLEDDHKRKGKTCASCHQRDRATARAPLSGPRLGGAPASAEVEALHQWLGPPDAWPEDVMGLWVDVESYGTFLVATVKVLNFGGGHRLPEGAQGEHITLEVNGEDGEGRPLEFLRGPRLPAWLGAPRGDAPGFLYARVLGDAQGHPVEALEGAASVLMDSRLLGDEHDELHFYYALPRSAPLLGAPWTVKARLVWRPRLHGDDGAALMEEASAQP